VGGLGEESSILYLSRYLLKINFTLDLYFASQNAEIYGLLMSHDNGMIEEFDIPKFLCRTTTTGQRNVDDKRRFYEIPFHSFKLHSFNI
jgi:hypothetical protein